LFITAGLSAQRFTWTERPGGRAELRESGSTVLMVHHGEQLPPGVPEDRKRCCYVHPVYTPGGVALTDDFPKDHYHHHGLFWAWPQVKTGGQDYDFWLMRGVRPKLESFHKSADQRSAKATMSAVWMAGEKPLLRERSTIVARPASGNTRDVEVTLVVEALTEAVTLAGSRERGKGYGGVSFRFAPRADTVIRTSEGRIEKDEDLAPHAWAELEATYHGKRARLRITADSRNPGEPNVWCLRFYGFLGPSFPGPKPYTVEPGKPLTLRYLVTAADVP
jgi:hypothetical protein